MYGSAYCDEDALGKPKCCSFKNLLKFCKDVGEDDNDGECHITCSEEDALANI